MFLQKLSQQSLNALPEVVDASGGSGNGNGGDGSEPGYESLPDNSSNDPGYETVEPSHSKDSKKDGSDYDPNYETLRPTIRSDSIDHYAKVLNKSNLDSNDGYSSIQPIKNKIISNEEDEHLGYCTISDDRTPEPSSSSKNHDYASIQDTTTSTKGLVPIEENVYSSISNDIDHGNKTKTHSSPTTTPSPIPMTSNTALTMSMTSTISDTKTLTSPSSDGSSSNTPIGYKNIRSTDQSQLTVSVSNYDSLTGSESDSNYESVRYLNAQDRENPYEQLYNESDIKYDTLKRDDTANSLYAISSKNVDNSKNSSQSSSSGSGLGGRSSSSLNNTSSDTAS